MVLLLAMVIELSWLCHSGASRNPDQAFLRWCWIPAFAGMTQEGLMAQWVFRLAPERPIEDQL
jgi:hypothetical protein